MIRNAWWGAPLAALALGCSEPRPEGTDAFVAPPERPSTTVAPAPSASPPAPFHYDGAALRNPFEAPVSGAAIDDRPAAPGPDLQRARTVLETFAIAQLQMVGVLAGGDRRVALLRDPGGHVHRVRVGDYVGRDFGRVQTIGDAGLDLVESIADGSGGWVRRSRALPLSRSGPDPIRVSVEEPADA